MKANKMLSMLVVMALILSTLIVSNVVADRKVYPDSGNVDWILSNDGFGSQARNLTCGEIITLQITNNSLTENKRYYVGVWNGTHWITLDTVESAPKANRFGDISISFHVPGWYELNHCPTTANGTGLNDSNGQWNISLFGSSTLNETNKVFSNINITIQIGNLYEVRFQEDGEFVDHFKYNTTMSGYVWVRNWTGSEFENLDTNWKLTVLNPGFNAEAGLNELLVTTYRKEIDFLINNADITSATNREQYYWVRVEDAANAALFSNISFPVLIDMRIDSLPTNAVWGDTIYLKGALYDFHDTPKTLIGYGVKVYAPVAGGYVEADGQTTFASGKYSLEIDTGSLEGFGAGTWYLGTYSDVATRVNMTHQPPYIPGFIEYYPFVVGTQDEATVTVHNTDDIVKSFVQTINVSVYNSSWMEDYEFRDMNIHIKGIKGWDGTRTYDRDDIVLVKAGGGTTGDTRSYYTFDYTFNETGTATIWASWPGNLTALDNHGSSYGNRFGNHSTSLIANITGITTLSVGTPGNLNVFIENVPEAVEMENPGDAGFVNGWINKSTGAWTNISIYGNEESSHKNATITITGCGLDITIDESDTPADNKYLLDYGFNDDTLAGAWYNVSIIPKVTGTLTITVTNDTDSVVRDYAVTGLSGSVTTSVGDDLEITVGTTETITLNNVNSMAKATVTFYNENWVRQDRLNASEKAGEFTFTPDVDDINKIGFIVVAAGVWDYYMYDIIEVVPVDDLEIEVTTPDAGNQTLTVGLKQDIIVNLLDPNGDPVTEDAPSVEGKLIDDDHDEDDPLQTFTFVNQGSGEWLSEDAQPWFAGQLVINGYNASDGIKHIGTTILDVENATVTYSPEYTTAGIGVENLTVGITVVDANGNLVDGTLYLRAEDYSGGLDFNTTRAVTLTDGVGDFEIVDVGDQKTTITGTLTDDNDPDVGNATSGTFNINFPTFILTPDTIYLGYPPYTTDITVTDADGEPIEGIYLTLISSIPGIISAQPDPVKTDEDGYAQLGINPLASGKLNVTIARNVKYVGGQLNWTNSVITDTYLTVANIKPLTITVSSLVVKQGDPLTITVKSAGVAVEGVDVTFGTETAKTSDAGTVTINAPDPGVDFTVMKVEAKKTGYATATQDVTVIKTWAITIVTPENVYAGESFTVTITAKGQTLAGASVSADGKAAVMSGGDGKVTFKAGSKGATHTITATFENYLPGTATITVKEKQTPGFELLTLIIALGIAFILLRRRKK